LEYTIEFGGDPERVTITTSGRADRETIDRFMEEVAADPRFRPGMPVLGDHRALDVTSLSSDDVKALGASASKLAEDVTASVFAVVVPDALAFGLTRMAEAHINPQLRIGIFYSLDEALAWLEKVGADT
jgi:hypothetical protein